ncbi:MAG TPA: SGNH/GDSL hydrolase family protein [Candidatus Nanopelagicales bacterium]
MAWIGPALTHQDDDVRTNAANIMVTMAAPVPDAAALAALVALPVRDERVRRIVVAAAKGGGGLLGVGTAMAGTALGVLFVEAALARRAIGPRRAVPPYVDGRYPPTSGGVGKGTSLRLVVLGDSAAAGLGVEDPEQTPGVIIARGVAEAADRPVMLTSVAVVGARTKDLADQVTRALHIQPQVAVLMIGANDVTHRDRPQKSVRLLVESVERLRANGSQVVVGTCPDLGTVRPVAQPLRAYMRRASRELAQAQAVAVAEAGGRPVRLADLLGSYFQESPEDYFSADRFHPSATGYAACAGALLPEVLIALGLRDPASTLVPLTD